MNRDVTEIKVKGKETKVPSTRIDDITIMVTGKFIRMAAVQDEDWLDGQVVDKPESFIHNLKANKFKADIFTFAQKIPATKPRYSYHMEWDNAAAIPITTYEDWWQQVSTDLRKDIKRASKREVIVRETEFNDELVAGVCAIHNDTPTRQGIAFHYYGQDFNDVKKSYGTYPEKSEFVGAYYKNELIGLIKIVYVGELACFMQILSKATHNDKRPTNALIAKAVEIAEKKGKSYLTYGKYNYGNKEKSSLIDFKHRNGFLLIRYPRYYVPLTLKGKIAIKMKLHLGLLGLLPSNLITILVNLRTKVNQMRMQKSTSITSAEPTDSDVKE